MVSQLAKIELLKIRVAIEAILAESKLRKTSHHVRLAALETSSDCASSSGILTLVTLASCLSKTTSRSPSDSLLCALCTSVVP